MSTEEKLPYILNILIYDTFLLDTNFRFIEKEVWKNKKQQKL